MKNNENPRKAMKNQEKECKALKSGANKNFVNSTTLGSVTHSVTLNIDPQHTVW